MVHVEHEDVLVVGQPHDGRPDQRAVDQVEPKPRLVLEDPLRFGVLVIAGQTAEVYEIDLHRLHRADELRSQRYIEDRKHEKVDHQEQRATDRILVRHDEQRRSDRDRRKHPEA